ncbi:hypothetical protein ACF1HJ_35555 [Streptomyces sp. NPDC013978]|uniref:hypothetical protein n=1 Tax=Streptomyces sp. NPDC013978 TaxID=3364869 RepID=UPI0036F5199A
MSLQTVADYIGRRTRWTAEGGLLIRGFPRWVRMLAMASVTLDTGCRVGKLCALRLEDLSPALEEVRIVRRPQNSRPDDPVSAEVYSMRRATRAALQRWARCRAPGAARRPRRPRPARLRHPARRIARLGPAVDPLDPTGPTWPRP